MLKQFFEPTLRAYARFSIEAGNADGDAQEPQAVDLEGGWTSGELSA